MKSKKVQPDTTIESEQKIAELTLGWQRTQADFQNFRRQVELDRQKLLKTASAQVLEDILPVLDNFQLAAKHAPAELENNNWVIGIKQIEKQLEGILANEGLVKIETIGQQFNPEFHEAIEHLSSDKPENEIVEEVSSGYTYETIVLRPAKVKVSSGKQ
ncbi:MAG: nucleotide exchange factor GrpE [Patescibacteria group bacterium]|jgi:molecular chaperone GrpE